MLVWFCTYSKKHTLKVLAFCCAEESLGLPGGQIKDFWLSPINWKIKR